MPPEVPVVVSPSVPLPVTGDPVTPKIDPPGTERPTLLTVPGVAAHPPLAFRNLFAVASPAAGAGTRPCTPPVPVSPVKTVNIAVACAPVRSRALAAAPVLFPLIVKAGIWARTALVTTFCANDVLIVPVPLPNTSPVRVVGPPPVPPPARQLGIEAPLT